MNPWESEWSFADTVVGNEPSVRAIYLSRRSSTGYLYSYSAVWSRVSPRVRAAWINSGSRPSRCDVEMEHGELAGVLGDGTRTRAMRVSGSAVPDFAIGAYLAAQTLAGGDTIRLTMFRCLPDRGIAAIESQAILGVVRAGEESRGAGGEPEPVWIIEGDHGYRFVAVIAKSDRLLLRSRTPQGSVGHSTDSYVRSR